MNCRSLDRRRHARRRISLPVGIDTSARPRRVGVTFDVSRSGLLAFSDSRFDPGDRLALTLCMGAPKDLAVEGTVVRVEPRCSDVRWRWALAVIFDRELPEAVALSPEPTYC